MCNYATSDDDVDEGSIISKIELTSAAAEAIRMWKRALVMALFVLLQPDWSAAFAAEKKTSIHPVAKAATGERSIKFPDTWSMGTLSIKQLKNEQDVSSPIGKAQGLVKVPQDARLELVLSYETIANMSSLEQLKPDDIQSITFRSGTDSESVDLEHVRHLTGLKELHIARQQDDVTDSTLTKLKGLIGLRKLDLSESGITNKGLALVAAQFPAMEDLKLNHDHITDSGLTELTKLKSLKVLELRHTPISDAGLKTIAKIATLTRLNVDETKITDDGIGYLQSMPALEGLWMCRDHVTSRSVKTLMRFPRLKQMSLLETAMDNEGVLSLIKKFGPHSVMWLSKGNLANEKVRQLRETGE